MWTFRIIVCVMLLALLTPGAPAQEIVDDSAVECIEYFNDTEIERVCTTTEEFTLCINSAEDAYEACREEKETWWGFIHCAASATVDGLACFADLIGDLIPI